MSNISKTFLLSTFSAILFFGTPSLAVASVPTDSSIARLAQISHFDESFKDGFKTGIMTSLTARLNADAKFQKLSPTQQQAYKNALDNFGAKIIQDLNTPEMTQKGLMVFKETTKKYYSQEEVDAMINFYQTPIGQSIVIKQSQAIQEDAQNLIKALQNDPQFNQKITTSVKLHSAELMEEIKKIKNSQ